LRLVLFFFAIISYILSQQFMIVNIEIGVLRGLGFAGWLLVWRG